MRLLIWVDGKRFSSDQLSNWVDIPGATPDANSEINLFQTGLYITSVVTYTAANDTIAKLIISLLDTWHFAAVDTVLDVNAALNEIGVTVGFINPNTDAFANPTTIAVSGQLFVTGATATVGANVYATTFVDANNLTFAYDGTLPAGVYDVTVTNPDGTKATLPQSLTLT